MKYFKNYLLIKFVEVNSIHPQEHSTTNSCFNTLYIKPLLNLKSKSTSFDSIQCFMETAKTASYRLYYMCVYKAVRFIRYHVISIG